MKINNTTLTGVRMGKGFKDELLAAIPLKEFISNTSRLEHGDRVIVSNPKKKKRSLTLEFQVTGADASALTTNRNALYTEFYKGTFVLSDLGFTTDVFHLVYTGNSVTYSSGLSNCACKVKATFDEPNPSLRTASSS